MYPYIELYWLKIYFVWVWIVICTILYLLAVYKFSKKYQLNFWKYFSYFPITVILIYLLGSYFYWLFQYKIFLPSLKEVLFLLSPYWFKFNFIWLSLWFLLGTLYFLSKVKYFQEKLKRIDVIFFSLMISVFFLWFFLVLWDNFIWRPTDSSIWVSAIKFCSDLDSTCHDPVTKLDWFVKVYPVWLFLSLVALISFLVNLLVFSIFKNRFWLSVFGFIVFLFLLNFVFIFQNYPRYLVFNYEGFIFDVKNYWTFVLILFIIIYFMHIVSRLPDKKNKKSFL